MTPCRRCNQPRTATQLRRGICEPCRAHDCTRHDRGTVACYTVCGCRCGACGRAWNSAESLRKMYAARGLPRRVDATGTRRRIQALWALGWSSDHIADAAPIPGGGHGVWQIAGNRRYVGLVNAAAIAHAYRQLSMTCGPSTVTTARARAHGYPPPLAWDDDTGPHGIDNPDATPYQQAPTAPKQRHAADIVAEVRLMLGTDSADGIARRLGYTDVESLAGVLARVDKPLADRYRQTRIVRERSAA